MAAGATYEPIATTTLASAAATITFSSITSAYTDLRLVLVSSDGVGSSITVRFNGDTATNYSKTGLYGNGTAASSTRASSQTQINLTANATPTTTLGDVQYITHIFNYANATTYKTVLHRGDRASAGTEAIVGLWRSTSAITSIVIKPSSGSWDTGSTFTLYGIKAA